jgi:hypothetical protein
MTDTPPLLSLQVLEKRYGPNYRWMLLLSVMLGTMASIMSSTIINVAIVWYLYRNRDRLFPHHRPHREVTATRVA